MFNEELTQEENTALKTLKMNASHIFVTGAGGFLGKAICKLLRAADIKVTGFARGDYPELVKMGVTMIQGDICNKKQVIKAMSGCDLVFHVASKAGVWGSKQSYFKPNVDGANNVIQACHELNIKRLIYTSTPSVTFSGVDEDGINESHPYANKYLNYYGESKAIAEQNVLNANEIEQSGLKTIALRPHLIWGPDDPHLVPRVLARAKAGKLKLVGKHDKLVDTIYIDNAAYAHILAAIKLNEVNAICAGKTYFISNDEPITMSAMLNKILMCQNLPAITKRVPAFIAYAVGALLEGIYTIFNKEQEPIMTKFVARQLSTSHYFDISAAKKDLGYTPLINIDQGMQRLKASLTTEV